MLISRGGWKDEKAQLRYLWQLMAEDQVRDTEIVCQISLGNDKLVKERMLTLTKQANLAANSSVHGDVNATLRMQDSLEAQASLYSGEVPIKLGLTILVHRPTLVQLEDACYFVSSRFKRPAWVVRETEYAWKLWVDTFPMVWNRMLSKPFQRFSTYLSGEAPGLMPLVKTRSFDKQGFELISTEGGSPIYLDLYRQHRHLGIFGATRSGKSVLASGILLQALARGLPISAMDFPRPDGTGTFSDLCHFFGEQASYFEISKEASNLFEPPNLKGLPLEVQNQRFDDYKDYLVEVLQTMVVGIKPRGEVNPDNVRSLLTLAVNRFFHDEAVRKRYVAAFTQGFGSMVWSQTPTLADFYKFCALERLQLLSPSTQIINALEYIKLRLRFWLDSRLGKAIAQPTSFRSQAPFLVIALTNLTNQEDATMLAMLTYLTALRRSLAAISSIFFLDEAPILFEYNAIANLVGKLYANGAKSGIRAIINAQEIESIMRSEAGTKIFANMDTKLIGRVESMQVEVYSRHFGYPRSLIAANGTEAYYPRLDGLYSFWMLDDRGICTPCRYYPSDELFAVVANNPEEAKAREEIMSQSKNKFEGVARCVQLRAA